MSIYGIVPSVGLCLHPREVREPLPVGQPLRAHRPLHRPPAHGRLPLPARAHRRPGPDRRLRATAHAALQRHQGVLLRLGLRGRAGMSGGGHKVRAPFFLNGNLSCFYNKVFVRKKK